MPPWQHQYVLSVISRDRIGIVAEVSGAIAGLGGDIADLRQSVLSGYFTMILLATFPGGVSAAVIHERIAGASAAGPASLTVTVLEPDVAAVVESSSAGDEIPCLNLRSRLSGSNPAPEGASQLQTGVCNPRTRPHVESPSTYLLTARGPDRVGFVASVSAFCARNELNILDLATTVAGGRYVMMLLVDVSRCGDLDALRRRLQTFGAEAGLEAVLQHEAIFRATNEVDLR